MILAIGIIIELTSLVFVLQEFKQNELLKKQNEMLKSVIEKNARRETKGVFNSHYNHFGNNTDNQGNTECYQSSERKKNL